MPEEIIVSYYHARALLCVPMCVIFGILLENMCPSLQLCQTIDLTWIVFMSFLNKVNSIHLRHLNIANVKEEKSTLPMTNRIMNASNLMSVISSFQKKINITWKFVVTGVTTYLWTQQHSCRTRTFCTYLDQNYASTITFKFVWEKNPGVQDIFSLQNWSNTFKLIIWYEFKPIWIYSNQLLSN